MKKEEQKLIFKRQITFRGEINTLQITCKIISSMGNTYGKRAGKQDPKNDIVPTHTGPTYRITCSKQKKYKWMKKVI
jgi:hypothetical protein